MNAFLGTCLIILPSFTYHWSESTLLLKHTSAVLQYKKYWCSALYYPAHWEWVVYLASGDAGCNVSFWNHKSDLQQVNISSVHKTLNIEHIVFPNRTKSNTAHALALNNTCEADKMNDSWESQTGGRTDFCNHQTDSAGVTATRTKNSNMVIISK